MQNEFKEIFFSKRKFDRTKSYFQEYNIDTVLELFLDRIFTEMVLQYLGISVCILLDFDSIEKKRELDKKKTYESASSMH